MKVRNLISERSGCAVANQFSIEHDGKVYFQSCESLIAEIDMTKAVPVTLGRHWDDSRTTMKYLNQFLRETVYGMFRRNGLEVNENGIRKAIADGIINYDEALV